MAIVQHVLAEANRQLADYRAARARCPSEFGSADGYFDGTPEDFGPFLLPIIYQVGDQWLGRPLWGIHKHRWPLDFHYCFGKAIDSRGERTDLHLQFDIRDLPKRFIGRYKIDRMIGCDRRSHRVIIGRALAADFSLSQVSASAKPQIPATSFSLSDEEIPF